MGGNVFPSKSRRYQKDEYVKLEKEVLGKVYSSVFVSDICQESVIQPLKYYRSKESFGDMDLVLNLALLKANWISIIIEKFKLGHGEWSKNGNVLSILYKEFQIDLIIQPHYNFQSTLDYFAWNDLGNLIGRISHKLGLKFGHEGTSVTIREGDNQIGTILVTKKIKDLLDILELDYNHWKNGFDTLDEMYTWVSSSKYFNKEIYALENRNHAARTRDKKRANYSGFLEWVEGKDLPEYPFEEMTSKDGYDIREPFFTDLICEKFPHVKEQYDALVIKYEEQKVFKKVFNGQIVMEVTGLQGKELGMFMEYCRRHLEMPEKRRKYLDSSELERRQLIGFFHNCYIVDNEITQNIINEYNEKQT